MICRLIQYHQNVKEIYVTHLWIIWKKQPPITVSLRFSYASNVYQTTTNRGMLKNKQTNKHLKSMTSHLSIWLHN